MNRTLSIAAPIVFIALLLGGWEIACRALALPSYLLPPPSEIVATTAQNLPLLAASA
jgi:NitT/TauT family transport system permease protein